MISVIVPVYNVEKYLNRCINSILAQTYQDYELILIDDGSTDYSGEICDFFQAKDDRIKVIHQPNNGLSFARNVGIEYSCGEYITFIDSDDYVAESYLEILLKLLEGNDSDISCCEYLRTGKECIKNIKLTDEFIILRENDILTFYLKKDLVSACAKLYRKYLFQNIRFPIGKINEDISTIFKVFLEAKSVSYSNNKLYFYYKNSESITKRKFTKNNINLVEAWKEVRVLSSGYSKEVKSLVDFRLAKAYFTLLGIIAYYGMKDAKADENLKKAIYREFKKNYKVLLRSSYLKFNRKIAVLLMCLSYDICCSIGKYIRYIKCIR